mmetsp:Transcript_12697/g.27027  ORF Transcript_12697/g.27027 Transcript_12697/m.27027 type:complete len:447 (-) Transcript_12697:37-1377(-)
MRLLIQLFCLIIFLVILPNAVASSYGNLGSSHGRRYAAYDYDLTTPQYTPDGRLLQVEYAINACRRDSSNPIVGAGINIPGDKETVLIMATISSPPPSSNPPQTQHSKENGMQSIRSTKEGNQRAQFRIIEVPLSTSSSLEHTDTPTILIGLSGVLSDATSLLQIAYSQLEEEQRVFGWHRLGLSPVGKTKVVGGDSGSATRSLQPLSRKLSQSIVTQPSETVLRLSRAIADKCQKHAFGGGLRPFGASLLLAGVDNNCQKHGTQVAMCETNPDGGYRSYAVTVKGNVSKLGEREENTYTSIDSPQLMVSGGSPSSHQKLKSLIKSRLQRLVSDPLASIGIEGAGENGSVTGKEREGDTIFLRQALISIVSSLVEEWRSRGDPLWSSPSSPSMTSEGENSKEDISKREQIHSKEALPLMEVVVASPKRGTFRLDQSDIARLMRPTS